MKIPIFIGLIALVTVIGYGMYTFEFLSYLGNNPTACNNCHVMDSAYEGWYHGAHKNWASCNDCHTPHSFIPKYIVKATSGYHHVSTFMFKDIPDAIRAKESSLKIVQENCIRCHSVAVANINMGDNTGEYCFECHRNVSHGERGISLLPYQHKEENR